MYQDEQIIKLEILSNDRIGLVYEITAAIQSLDIPIKEHKAKVFTDYRKKKMSMLRVCVCSDEQRTQELLKKLKKIKGVVSIASDQT